MEVELRDVTGEKIQRAEGCNPEVGQWIAWSLHSIVVTGWNVSFLIGLHQQGGFSFSFFF